MDKHVRSIIELLHRDELPWGHIKILLEACFRMYLLAMKLIEVLDVSYINSLQINKLYL